MAYFSVIVPLYNKEKDIAETIASVLSQSFEDFKIIIIDDGSTDDSLKIATSIKDDRIKIIQQQNAGVAATRNRGVAMAQSPYIVFLDADDLWLAHHLEVLYELTQNYDAHLWFATSYYKQFKTDKRIKMSSPIHDENFESGPVKHFFKNSLTDSLAWTSAVAFKKEFFEKLGGFDTTITYGAGEDTDLWIKAALQSNLVFSTTFTAVHKMDGSNRISHTPTNQRNFINLDAYESAIQKQPYLKAYLDINRFSIALQFKMAGDLKTYHEYLNKIEINHLNRKQRFLLKLPGPFLQRLQQWQHFLKINGFNLSAFK